MQRQTWQREAVKTALSSRDRFVSAQDLHNGLRDSGSTIGLATVYRALADLAATGDADLLRAADGEARYRACESQAHHHHLICRDCGRTVEIEADEIEAWAAGVAVAHGFVQPRHVVDVFGLCSECAVRSS